MPLIPLPRQSAARAVAAQAVSTARAIEGLYAVFATKDLHLLEDYGSSSTAAHETHACGHVSNEVVGFHDFDRRYCCLAADESDTLATLDVSCFSVSSLEHEQRSFLVLLAQKDLREQLLSLRILIERPILR